MVVVTGCTVLVDFVSAEFSTTIFTDVSYWLNAVTMQSAVIILLFVERTISKEKERGRNEQFRMLSASLQEAFLSLNAQNLNGTFKEYIAEDNHRRKLAAYLAKLNAKKARCDDRIARLGFRIRRMEIRAQDRQREPQGWLYKPAVRAEKTDGGQGRVLAEEDRPRARRGGLRPPREVREVVVRRDLFGRRGEGERRGRPNRARGERRGVHSFDEGAEHPRLRADRDVLRYVGVHLRRADDLPHAHQDHADRAWAVHGAVSGQDFIRRKMCAKLMTRFNYVKQFKEKNQYSVREVSK